METYRKLLISKKQQQHHFGYGYQYGFYLNHPLIMIVFQNSAGQSSREPRLQNHNSKVNIIEATDRIDIKEPDEFVQRTNVEAEILGNIDLVNLDSLSPQPSILSTITHGLTTIHSGEDSKRKDDGKIVKRANKDW